MMENRMGFQSQTPQGPTYFSGNNSEAPQKDLDIQEPLAHTSPGKNSGTADQGSIETESGAHPRVESCSDMDTRPPLEVMGMNTQLGTAAQESAFLMIATSIEECGHPANQGTMGEVNTCRASPPVDRCPGMDTRRPLEVMGMEAPLEVMGMEAPLEVMGMEAPLEVMGMEAPLEVMGMEAPLEVMGMEAPLDGAFHMQELLSELSTYPYNRCQEEASSGEPPHNCQPCLLHIAMGKGLTNTLRRFSESSTTLAGSHGLFLTQNDKDCLFTLFQSEEGTLSAGDVGLPLARLEVLGSSEQNSGTVGQEEEESSSLFSLSGENFSCRLMDPEPQLNQHTVQEILPPSQNYPASPQVSHSVPGPCDSDDLLDGVVFGAKYLGSTQLHCEKHQMASMRMRQAQEAVDRVKAPDGESQPMTEVDVMVSTQRVKVLAADTQEAFMDHPLQTISYTADIGNIVVIMVQKKSPHSPDQLSLQKRPHKMLCHVFQSFDVYIQKERGEMLGVAVVESGWGSLLPTVVIANLMHGGPAERSGELSIGDHVTNVNSTSLVGLPFSTCQGLIRDLKSQSEVILSIVRCPPVITAIIQRPDTTYQLGFCVDDGVICSLVRGGIAERGGIRVGHRIIEINGQSVVATAHEKIIQTLLDATGKIHIKTMPSSTYRLLTGQETPVYL
ncbi:amyloid-beta A4 precursor protein-binding family A member 3 isoform X2 [Dendropsophus ebraccatus]|uniref:amyloid-beta A4 precursor protein-binding family A member 3 isoform X2 n=1 Tax=Dendropsophus ebraccatus TaxID=150705 RepID=UPI003831D25C